MTRSILLPALFATFAVLAAGPASAQTAIKVFAADALQPAMADIAAEFQKSTGGKFKLEPVFGASAALRERIEKGEVAHVLAADTADTRKLADGGRSRGPAVVFAKPKSGGDLSFIVVKDAPPAAGELAGFLRFGPGRAILTKFGFGVP
jgi:ABC-type molybdate transport system substrate-binding protein